MSGEILKKINTGLATVLSAIFPGLGQFYNGKLEKGFIFSIVGSIVFYFMYIVFITIIDPYYYEPPFDHFLVITVFYFIIWMYSIIDANKDSKKLW